MADLQVSSQFLRRCEVSAWECPREGALQEIRWEKPRETGRFLPIPLENYARPGKLANGTLSLKPGLQMVRNIPFQVAAVKDNVDVGRSSLLLKQWSFGTDDPYYERSAFDGTPETIIFSVPRKQYVYAYLLCAIEDSPNKTPVLTARLTRFVTPGGRGDAIADTTVVLPKPGETPMEGICQAGTITYQKDGQNVQAPLWLARLRLDIGQIQDLLVNDDKSVWQSADHFDLELTKALSGGMDFSAEKPVGPDSAVHVLGLTLEESPATMICRSKQVGNIFYRQENPAFQLQFSNVHQPGRFTLQWTFTDYEGLKTKGQTSVHLGAEGQPRNSSQCARSRLVRCQP